jgi:hypothetical protein
MRGSQRGGPVSLARVGEAGAIFSRRVRVIMQRERQARAIIKMSGRFDANVGIAYITPEFE